MEKQYTEHVSGSVSPMMHTAIKALADAEFAGNMSATIRAGLWLLLAQRGYLETPDAPAMPDIKGTLTGEDRRQVGVSMPPFLYALLMRLTVAEYGNYRAMTLRAGLWLLLAKHGYLDTPDLPDDLEGRS